MARHGGGGRGQVALCSVQCIQVLPLKVVDTDEIPNQGFKGQAGSFALVSTVEETSDSPARAANFFRDPCFKSEQLLLLRILGHMFLLVLLMGAMLSMPCFMSESVHTTAPYESLEYPNQYIATLFGNIEILM